MSIVGFNMQSWIVRFQLNLFANLYFFLLSNGQHEILPPTQRAQFIVCKIYDSRIYSVWFGMTFARQSTSLLFLWFDCDWCCIFRYSEMWFYAQWFQKWCSKSAEVLNQPLDYNIFFWMEKWNDGFKLSPKCWPFSPAVAYNCAFACRCKWQSW